MEGGGVSLNNEDKSIKSMESDPIDSHKKNPNFYPMILGIGLYICIRIILGGDHFLIKQLHFNFRESLLFVVPFVLFFLNSLAIVFLSIYIRKEKEGRRNTECKKSEWIALIQSVLVVTVTSLFGFLIGLIIFR